MTKKPGTLEPSLIEVDFSDLNDYFFGVFFKRKDILKNLKVAKFRDLRSAIFLRFYLKCFKSLEELEICFDYESKDAYMVRLFEFKELLFKMDLKNLIRLDISGSIFLSEELLYVSQLTTHQVPLLKIFQMRNCKNIIHDDFCRVVGSKFFQ